jgi:hypothetical protein
MNTDTLPPHAVRGVILIQWTYWCSLAMAALSVRFIPPGSVRTGVMLIPVLTGLLCVCVAYWLYEACDEFIRREVLKCAAYTAIVTAACSLVYFILELTGFPRVSMLWINLLGWSVFNLQFVLLILRSR